MFRVNPSEAQLERITVHGDTIGLIPDGSISPLNLPRDAVTQQVIRYLNYQYLALLCELMTGRLLHSLLSYRTDMKSRQTCLPWLITPAQCHQQLLATVRVRQTYIRLQRLTCPSPSFCVAKPITLHCYSIYFNVSLHGKNFQSWGFAYGSEYRYTRSGHSHI
jgi:hypothetical protein